MLLKAFMIKTRKEVICPDPEGECPVVYDYKNGSLFCALKHCFVRELDTDKRNRICFPYKEI